MKRPPGLRDGSCGMYWRGERHEAHVVSTGPAWCKGYYRPDRLPPKSRISNPKVQIFAPLRIYLKSQADS